MLDNIKREYDLYSMEDLEFCYKQELRYILDKLNIRYSVLTSREELESIIIKELELN